MSNEEQDQSVVENPYATFAGADAPGEAKTYVEGNPYNYKQRKRTILLLLLGWAMVTGACNVLLGGGAPTTDFLLSIPSVILSVAWCYVDASEHEHRIRNLMRLALIFLFPIAFPVYLFQTRGVAGFKALGWTLLFVLAVFLCMLAGMVGASIVLGIVHVIRNG
jgi:hypothetical protein